MRHSRAPPASRTPQKLRGRHVRREKIGPMTNPPLHSPPAFLFDLDGTLVDSVYQHVLAWREALADTGMELSVWRIHRRIGMSGGLFVNALSRETGVPIGSEDVERLQNLHGQAFQRMASQVRP